MEYSLFGATGSAKVVKAFMHAASWDPFRNENSHYLCQTDSEETGAKSRTS